MSYADGFEESACVFICMASIIGCKPQGGYLSRCDYSTIALKVGNVRT